MKSFKKLRESLGRMPKGDHVWDKKIKGIKTMIHKDGSKFTAYIDGDRLDSYRSQKEAEKMITTFMKQYKG